MVGIAVTYLTSGRFDLAKNSAVIPVMDQVSTLVSGNPEVASTMP
jgi:hypothetical protein